jgi:hypothetical protein
MYVNLKKEFHVPLYLRTIDRLVERHRVWRGEIRNSISLRCSETAGGGREREREEATSATLRRRN